MKKSDDATMDAAFAAFWVSAERYAGAAAYASLRQAFKNGAAFPLGRGVTRGKAALDQLATQDEAARPAGGVAMVCYEREGAS